MDTIYDIMIVCVILQNMIIEHKFFVHHYLIKQIF
jgi:hypothetical protein